jgi:ABC-type tungstate transport system substrate-binding protein
MTPFSSMHTQAMAEAGVLARGEALHAIHTATIVCYGRTVAEVICEVALGIGMVEDG